MKQLQHIVTHAAVQRLRARWGAPATHAMRSVATLYDSTRVCVFCNQFFIADIEAYIEEEGDLRGMSTRYGA